MELEGLKRSLEFLDDGDVMIGELVTDRHPQVRKYLRTQRPGVSHLIDAWHVSKGLKKKLLAASKSKGCDAIALWCESIVNHIYHAVQVGAGDADLAEAVWLSVLNHIKDKHDGHSALYDRCKHGDLKPRYIERLMGAVEDRLDSRQPDQVCPPQPPPLASSLSPAEKEALIAQKLSRFNLP
ncbi:hypothetical protein HPB48_015315 [Haemaphysalis longicornis]|uniref:Transposase n=1 Tax=Haemaphysalis longicornis TaxID=44386 RepID=A0A9J6FQZ4_HAELO|nr:hypothetical protein HPB48_015315 [Haemaphysalis longicornis]